MARPPRPSWLYSLVAVLSWPVVRLVYRLRVTGREHVPDGGCVVAANHWSNFDPWPLGLPLYPRRFLSWVPLAFRVLTKNKRTDETITRMTGREVVVRTHVEAPRQLDGDLIAPGKELRASCVHGRLLIRVPR